MMKRRLFLSGIILLALAGCAKYDRPIINEYDPNGYYCQQIVRDLHGGSDRHNAGAKLTAIGKARLMQAYKQYHCNT